MSPASCFVATAALIGWSALAGFSGSVHAAEEPVIMLPPLEVSAALQTNPWRFAALSGIEVLSSCSEGTTRSFIEAEFHLEQLFAALVPAEFQVQLAVPKIIVLSDQKRTLSASQNLVAGLGDADARSGKVSADEGRHQRAAAVRFMPNLRLSDADMVAVFAVIDEGRFDPDRLGLTSDYVRFALDRRTPPLPVWLVDGLTRLSTKMSFTREEVVFAADDWASPTESDPSRTSASLPRTLMPLGELFDMSRPADPAAEATWLWRAQAALFIRWAFDGDETRRTAFWNFVRRASEGPITEAVFQEYFGASYTEAGDRLTAYLSIAERHPVRYRPGRLAALPKYQLRLATDTEIGRIKGDWERLEIAYVKARFPQYVTRYEEQATRTLTKAYAIDSHDVRLLAVLGLHATDSGKDDQAHGLLESAARAEVVRPRVYFELARMRYVQALAHPGGVNGRLAAAQVNAVLEPLRRAHAQQPPLAQTYVLAAEAWVRGGVRLSQQHWELLEEGLKLFPGHLGLIYQVAALKVIQGKPADAAALVERGIQLSPTAAGRAGFEELQAALAAGG